MYEMGAEALRQMLALPLPAVLSTLRRDGSPYTVPLWFLWEGMVPDEVHPSRNPPSGHVWVVGGETSTWVGHLRMDPRMSLCIDVEGPPAMHVGIDGTAELWTEADSDPATVLRRVVVKYVGRGDPENYEAVDEYMESVESASSVLFKVRPSRWRAVDLSEFEAGRGG